MISSLTGTINYIGTNSIEIHVNGVGYKIFTTPDMLGTARIGASVTMYTHTHVREDALDLFGFDSREKLELFEKLITVSGIGPKTALGVLSLASVADIETAIVRGDAAVLTKVSGIGKKTAERIVLELAGKISAEPKLGAQTGPRSEDGDVIDALVGLGYTVDEARSALKNIDVSVTGVNDKVKAALKMLGKK